jgi:hypothetical protein
MPKKASNDKKKKQKDKGKAVAKPTSFLGQRSREEDEEERSDPRRAAEGDLEVTERQPNLLHEDDFGDEYEQEHIIDDDGLMVDEDEGEEEEEETRFFRAGVDQLEVTDAYLSMIS